MPVRQLDPVGDVDAALKLSVDSLLLDGRFKHLAWLLSEESKVTALEGEPGWTIELRDSDDPADFPEWPAEAEVRAAVDPDFFRLGHPDFYCTMPAFRAFVRRRIETSPEISEAEAYRASPLAEMMRRS